MKETLVVDKQKLFVIRARVRELKRELKGEGEFVDRTLQEILTTLEEMGLETPKPKPVVSGADGLTDRGRRKLARRKKAALEKLEEIARHGTGECTACMGRGFVLTSERIPDWGNRTFTQDCEHPCPDCDAKGYMTLEDFKQTETYKLVVA